MGPLVKTSISVLFFTYLYNSTFYKHRISQTYLSSASCYPTC